jgi:hypothetical protein
MRSLVSNVSDNRRNLGSAYAVALSLVAPACPERSRRASCRLFALSRCPSPLPVIPSAVEGPLFGCPHASRQRVCPPIVVAGDYTKSPALVSFHFRLAFHGAPFKLGHQKRETPSQLSPKRLRHFRNGWRRSYVLLATLKNEGNLGPARGKKSRGVVP